MVKRIALLLGLLACGRGSPNSAPVARRDGGPVAIADAAELELPAVALGLGSRADFDYRKRGGQPAFRAARKAEAREDWPAVVAACREALAADKGHLEAAWLLAVAYAKTGQLDQALAPLQLAVAGDFAKWAQPSLDQPALQPFLATATGRAWRRRVEADRAQLAPVLAHAVIVNAGGDLFAVDAATPRWYRLTDTHGGVIAGLALAQSKGLDRIGFVTRTRPRPGTSNAVYGVGVFERRAVHTQRPTPIGAAPTLRLAFRNRDPDGFIVSTGATWQRLGEDGKLVAITGTGAAHPGYFAYLFGGMTLLVQGPTAVIEDRDDQLVSHTYGPVEADWDHGFASAMRIGKSGRVVTAPSPALIDSHSLAWSGDRASLAFVAVDDRCKPTATSTVFVADVATGRVQQLEVAHHGLALQWIGDRALAIAGDRGVSLVDLGGGAPVVLEGATDLVLPRRRSRCTNDGDQLEPLTDPDDALESPVGDSPTDAGVR